MTSATGKGDFGKTHLNGMNFIKGDYVIAVLARLDKCQTIIGKVALAYENQPIIYQFCHEIMIDFYTIMGIYYKNNGQITIEEIQPFVDKLIQFSIDIKKDCPQLRNFILPNKKNITAFEARTEIRICEGYTSMLDNCDGLKKYLNRLSSCMYAISIYKLSDKDLELSKYGNKLANNDYNKYYIFLSILAIINIALLYALK